MWSNSVSIEIHASPETIHAYLADFARITELRALNLIAWESTDHKVVHTAWRFEIEKQNDATRVTQRVTFYPLNLFANAILYLFRVPRVESENRASFERIRQKLETEMTAHA